MSRRDKTPVVHRIWSEDHALWIVVTRTNDVNLARTAALAEAEQKRGGSLDLSDYVYDDDPQSSEQAHAIELLKQSPTRIGYGRFQVGFHDDGEPGGRFWHHDRTEGERGATPFVEWQLEVDW